MTDWTARIDALPVLRDYNWYVASKKHDYDWDRAEALQARLSLAAERLKEPHGHNCRALWSLTAPDCTCGKYADLLKILEGK